MTDVRRAAFLLSLWMTSACVCGVAVEVDAGMESLPVVDAGTPDAGTPDAGQPDAGPPSACLVEVVATSPDCNQDCEVHLFLPSGRRYCTLTCARTEDCTPYGPTLICAPEVGACMRPCTGDAECLAQGFPRCHPAGAFCDTLPACQNDQFCVDNGLTTCVVPGNYCQ